jgi:hypothetical protein
LLSANLLSISASWQVRGAYITKFIRSESRSWQLLSHG